MQSPPGVRVKAMSFTSGSNLNATRTLPLHAAFDRLACARSPPALSVIRLSVEEPTALGQSHGLSSSRCRDRSRE